MKKRKLALLLVLILVFAAIVGVGMHFYPIWKAAEMLEESLDFTDFSYQLDLELNKEELESGQIRVLEILAELTGSEKEAMYFLTIKGSVWEDKVHALIYPKGAAEPLLELYFSDELDVINEAMLYNAIRENLLGENALLSILIPVQEKSMYMSLEQVEKLFGIDLSNARQFTSPFQNRKFTTIQYFAGLGAMTHSKDENRERFEIASEQVQLRLDLPSGKESDFFAVQLYVEEPTEVWKENKKLLTELGVVVPDEKIRILKSISVYAVPGEGQGLEMPTEFVSQNVIDAIVKLRELFAGWGKAENTP